jgi:hypothetical protein
MCTATASLGEGAIEVVMVWYIPRAGGSAPAALVVRLPGPRIASE